MPEIAKQTGTGILYNGTSNTRASGGTLKKPTFVDVRSIERLKYLAGYYFSRTVQGICYPIFYLGYHICFDLKISGRENLRGIKGPVIFVANHIGAYDSFIFDLFVPPFSAIPPFRFMGTTQFKVLYLAILKYTGIIQLTYFMFGVFKVTYGQGVDKALIPAYKIIENGGTVAIFPEGRIWYPEDHENQIIGPFKWGATILAQNTGALVVPVAFKKYTGGRRLNIKIGKVYTVDKDKNSEFLTEEMRSKVLELHQTL